MEIFQGREIVIATKHGKEAVIAPLLEKALGLRPFAVVGLDTDGLGTFTGEVERRLGPLETARLKCEMAMKLSGVDLAIASEGSFGMHPSIPFAKADDELLVLLDQKNDLEIIGRELTLETNFNKATINDLEELDQFAQKVGFPDHALILKGKTEGHERLIKGIKQKEQLEKEFRILQKEEGHVVVETDMRAMNNPTRMKAIKKATDKLIKNIMSACPDCGIPGFTVKEWKRGLPCSWCGQPTRSIQSEVYSCSKCGCSKTEKVKRENEDPMYCDHCNP